MIKIKFNTYKEASKVAKSFRRKGFYTHTKTASKYYYIEVPADLI